MRELCERKGWGWAPALRVSKTQKEQGARARRERAKKATRGAAKMAECLLLKSGGQTKKLPVLNASYPANVTNWQGEQATFKVEISTAGVPAEYTYQWYRDGAKWTGATNATVSWSSAAVGSHSIYCVVTNKAGEVTSRVATLTVKESQYGLHLQRRQ